MIGNIMGKQDQQKQFIPPTSAVYHSYDGNNQRIKLEQARVAQCKFLRCLNNLIIAQNNNQKGNIIILPFQVGQLYIHFKDDKMLRNNKVHESNDSTYIPQPRNIMPYLPQFSPYASFMSAFQQEQFRMNPMLQSQDRFPTMQRTFQPQQEQHIKQEEIRLLPQEQEYSEPQDSGQQEPNMSDRSFRIKKKKKGNKVNDTKNITKNFSKAIISYIMQSKELGLKILTADQFDEFLMMLRSIKNNMTNIKHLRDLWVDNPEKKEFNRAFRIFSSYFIKSQSVPYIYNSRIANTGWHLKYRYNLLRALREPENFKYIKDI